MPREGSRRRCIEGANLYFIEQQKCTCCRVAAREQKTKYKRHTHSRYPGGTVKICVRAKQYPQPVVPGLNYVTPVYESVITTQAPPEFNHGHNPRVGRKHHRGRGGRGRRRGPGHGTGRRKGAAGEGRGPNEGEGIPTGGVGGGPERAVVRGPHIFIIRY